MFDLMRLPPEVRIKIYEYALVGDVIRIVRTVHPFRPNFPSRLDLPSGFGQVHESWASYGEPNPNKSVTLRSRRVELMRVENAGGEEVWDEISTSYGIEPDRFSPVVNLFLTSRKVYSETWPVFYQQNAFAFTTPLESVQSAECCLRFLYDRPYHALRHIRELHLLVGNSPKYPIRFELSSDPWQCLLDEISRNLSVRVLVLYIRGRIDDAYWYDLVDLPWREWLWRITGLQELHVDLIGTSTHEENIAFVKQMRSKMVVGGELMGTEGFVLGQRSMLSLPWTAKDPGNSLLTSSQYPAMEENYCS